MARIFSFFLIILAINSQVMSLSIYGIDLKTIKDMYHYMNLAYTKGFEYANRDLLQKTNPQQQFKNMMTEIRTISKRLENFENHMDDKLDGLGTFLLNNIDNMMDISEVKSKLINHIEDVNKLFRRGMAFNENENYNNDTLRAFIHQVLDDEHNLEYSLSAIYNLIFPDGTSSIREGFLKLAQNYAKMNYKRLCDRDTSPQQHMYYIYMIIMRTHLRGFTTLTQAYSMKTILNNSNYTQERQDMKKMCKEQFENYSKIFIQEFNNFRADIRRCDIRNPIIDKNVYQLDGVFRVLVNEESRIKAAVYKQRTPSAGGCEEIRSNSYVKYYFSNCKSYGSISGCPESTENFKGKSIRYSSFEADTEFFGHSKECNHTSYEITRATFPKYAYSHDDICVCSVSITGLDYMPTGKKIYELMPDSMVYEIDRKLYIDDPKIMKISIEPQYSKIIDNMVVAGVRFILHDNAIHLQIQQKKISENETAVPEAVWKPVDVDSENENMHINISYADVHRTRSHIYLDDVMIHPRLFVTGVKLHPTNNDDGFELHVHGSQYDIETGRLSGNQQWFKPGDYVDGQPDYKRKRNIIMMNDPDNPIFNGIYYSDPGTNKVVQFQHTSVKKDAGYHTVPFFDGQSVESPKFPLSGVGLFYRYKKGFGGYISPRLLTYNVGWEIEFAYKFRKRTEKAYERCGLEIPLNAQNVDEYTPCETLRKIVDNQID